MPGKADIDSLALFSKKGLPNRPFLYLKFFVASLFVSRAFLILICACNKPFFIITDGKGYTCLSQDLRDHSLGALDRGESPTAIARRFEVSRMWVYQVRKRWKEEGQRHSLPMGCYRRSCIAFKEAQIRQWIEATPDLMLAELSERLAA